MKKYYIGFGILLAVCLGALIYTVGQGGYAKTDAATNKAVEQVGEKLDTYNYEHTVPATLAVAGIKNVPSTVQYTKLSDSKYKICFDYKTAATGFDASWTSLFLGGISGGSPADNSSYDNSGYFDSSVESTHKKGPNCQTVDAGSLYSPYSSTDINNGFGSSSSSSGSGGDRSACASFSNSDGISGDAVVSSVDTTTKQINLQASDQYIYDAKDNALPTVAAIKYDSSSLMCDANFQATTADKIHPGDTIEFYMKSSTDLTATIIYIIPAN